MAKKILKEVNIKEIWKIRDYIQDLEILKDDILIYVESQVLKKNLEKMWISDIKEMYYNVVASWEMLNAASKGNESYLKSSKNFIETAKSRLAQSISELKSFKDEIADELSIQVKHVFNRCYEAIIEKLNVLAPKKKLKQQIKTVIKISNTEYHIPCFECGNIAVKFNLGFNRFKQEVTLNWVGITTSKSFDKKHSKEVFKLLEENNFKGIHSFMKKNHDVEGLDAYCPECDKIYCRVHYNAREEFDEGFYDCTYGTCPKGHERIIDD
ncbi:MAG: hypothetical protein ACTSRI_09935 [Promethearchaeota archaeon]